jgi:hypothetical protein
VGGTIQHPQSFQNGGESAAVDDAPDSNRRGSDADLDRGLRLGWRRRRRRYRRRDADDCRREYRRRCRRHLSHGRVAELTHPPKQLRWHDIVAPSDLRHHGPRGQRLPNNRDLSLIGPLPTSLGAAKHLDPARSDG